MQQNNVCYRTLQFEQPWALENYRRVGGYVAWEKILREQISPAEVIEQIKATSTNAKYSLAVPR